MSQLEITAIKWHNIYLQLTLAGEHLQQYTYYITDLQDHTYPMDCIQGATLTLNIVNVKHIKLLENGKWFFMYEKDGCKQLLSVSKDCGYLLDQFDKVFRYGKECYAYIINFQIATDTLLQKLDGDQHISYAHDALICCMFTTYMKRNKGDKKDILLESDSIIQFIRKSLFIITKSIIRMLYAMLYALRKKDGKHVLFMSETRSPISGNLKAIDERMKDRGLMQNFQVSYSFSKTLQQSKLQTLLSWSRLLWLIAKQDYIFIDDYSPIFKTITPKSKTKLIQTWHAGVGFKSVGYSRFGKAGSPLPKDSCHRKYDYALVGGDALIDVYEEVFAIDKENFIATGLPRLDNYLNEDHIREYKASFYKTYPTWKDKKIIMFAPTYRGNTQKEAYYPMDKINFDRVYELCAQDYIFMIKLHPFILEHVDIPVDYRERIYDFSDKGDINELFYITDILITDFSSNIYEFSLQQKPIIFYAFDMDYYQLTRGVHRTLNEAPGTVCTSFDEVLQVIENKTFGYDKLRKFKEQNFNMSDQLASDMVIDKLLLHKTL